MSDVSRSACRFLPAFGLACAGLIVPAAAQSPALYALNESGLLSVNATQIDKLPGSKWVSLVVDGSDRYALRANGLVYKNGVELYELKCTDSNDDNVDEGDWVGITFFDGSLWALSELGYLAQDGVCITQLSANEFLFTSIITGPAGTWELRSDGAVFENNTFANTFALSGGDTLDLSAEGGSPLSSWNTIVIGPDNKVWGLRSDGKIVRGDFTGNDPSPGTIIAALPFDLGSPLYTDLDFTGTEMWLALRGNGDVYQEPITLNPLIDFSGTSPTCVDLLQLPESMDAGTTDMSFMALRGDGKLFRETGVDPVFDLPKSKYRHLALSFDPADLTHIFNAKPITAQYTVQALSGTPVSFPILATDTDLATDQILVTLDELTLPAGAVYDEMTRIVTWDDPVKGSYKLKFEVNDGVNTPVKVTETIKVSDPDLNVDKNKSPKVSKLKNVVGHVGDDLAVPILAVDPDGDVLTITVDDTLAPFTQGATFDAMTNTFLWSDPELSDIDKYTVTFLVSDGIKTVKLKVTIQIVSSLLTF